MPINFKLNINEICYSIQGEGFHAGRAVIFIRLQGCSSKGACYATGMECDTEFISGSEYTANELTEYLKTTHPPCRSIVWTGGEPCDQLTDEVVAWFKDQGYWQAIETSGLKVPPNGLDWVTISPKCAEHVIQKKWKAYSEAKGYHCDELRYIRHKGQSCPQRLLKAKYYCISPHSDGMTINRENLTHCIELCKANPDWYLSVQQHKIWGVL